MVGRNGSLEKRVKRPRSPAAPSRSIIDCFADANKLYEKYSHGTFTKAEIASTLGISAISGPFNQRLFSIKEYGLLEGSDQSYKVSNLFMEMHSSGAESTPFRKASLEAIKKSPIFSELIGQFPNKIPDIKTIGMRLETQKKFNPERALSTAAIFRESLTGIGILDGSGNMLPIRSAESPLAPHGQLEGVAGEPPSSETAKQFRLEVPLKDGRKAIVFLPGAWTVEDAEKIAKVLVAAAED